jgi:CheY-like chemotaxis protein
MIDIREMTVLIVDDMITMCKSIHSMMKVIGYGEKFIYANNGKEALGILQKEPVDLVLLDYNMPEMSGAEVLSQIRGERNLRDLPVIMVTAHAYQDYVAEAAESVIDAYLLKPLTIKALEEKISLVVEKANNPPPMVEHLKRAMDFDGEGDMDAAIRETKLAIEAEPNSSRPIRDLGYYYYKNNDLQEAERWLLKAAEMNYMDVFAFHYLGELYLKGNDIEKAQRYFEKAMKISPRHLSRGINFGKTLVQMKMIPRAIKVFDQALKLSGSTIELREEIADFCIEERVNEYAAKLLESIIREKPDRSDLFFKLGKALENSGDIKKAVTYLVRADGVNKKNIEVKIHLAKGYLTLGKPILAEKVLKEILKINPNHKEAKGLLRQCV